MSIQEIANKFMEAYGVDYQYTYQFIKNECLSIFSNNKSFSLAACNWMDKNSDEMELWILENIIAKLSDIGYPKAHTRAINDLIWMACYKEWKNNAI